jgi:major intracellular serine protease
LKKIAHYFRAAVAAVVLPAATQAADSPELRRPETAKPLILQAHARSADKVDPNVAWLKVPAAWEATRGEGVVVYVGDDGLDAAHQEFRGLKVEKRNYSTSPPNTGGEHGTHVAGTVCGQKELDGIAPRIKKLVSHKVLGDSGSGSFAWLAASIRDASKEPGVYNASLGSGPMSAVKPSEFDADLRKAIADGIEAGMIFVFAAGNDDSRDPVDSVGFPARYGEELPVVVVAAADAARGVVADFSSRGKAVYITAPGVNVVSALPGGRYALWDGTSMATPHISGVAALWLSVNQDVPRRERQQRFADWLRSVASVPTARDRARGYGRPDVSRLAPKPVPPAPPGRVTLTLDSLTPAARQQLAAAGVTDLSLTLGTGVAQAPSATIVVPSHQPAPVSGSWHPQPVATQPWYPPAHSPLPQWVPGPCPGGVCVPPPAPRWVPGQVIRSWVVR